MSQIFSWLYYLYLFKNHCCFGNEYFNLSYKMSLLWYSYRFLIEKSKYSTRKNILTLNSDTHISYLFLSIQISFSRYFFISKPHIKSCKPKFFWSWYIKDWVSDVPPKSYKKRIQTPSSHTFHSKKLLSNINWWKSRFVNLKLDV